MRREEEIVTGAAIVCGGSLLVPLLRVRASALTDRAGIGEADLAAFVAHGADGRARVIAVGEALPDAAAWSAWLAAHPGLLAAIGEQLAAHRAAHAAPEVAPRTP